MGVFCKYLLVLNVLIFLSAFQFQQASLYAQHVSGQVIDYKTKEPIPFVNIYFNNSMTGTTSDIDGYFKLDVSSNLGQEIIISIVGYKTYIMKEYNPDVFYEVNLEEEVMLLGEVVVSADDGVPRKVKMDFFLKEFLGTSRNAKSCVIQNEDDIRLIYSETNNSISVTSDKPIVILNKSLGYKIHYHLEEFVLQGSNLSYRGYARFEEDSITDNRRKRIDRRRFLAYKGSRMEFFRQLWKNDLKSSGIEVYDASGREQIDLFQYVTPEERSVKSLLYGKTVLISSSNSISYLRFITNDSTLFTKAGYFDPEGVSWNGYMATKRIGDLLPYEYEPND
jgi:hypothetical protein